MKKTKNTSVDVEGRAKYVQDIIDNWKLKDHKIDEGVMSDIWSAIHEAYMLGCLHGGSNNDKHDEALDFFRE